MRTVVTSDEYKTGMRFLAGAVNIVTTVQNGNWFGMTATAVCSASAEPPTVLVCVNERSATHEALVASGMFCVNVLGAHDSALSPAFSGCVPPQERFSHGRWKLTRAGGLPTLEGALASFDCRIVNIVRCGSHSIFLGEVLDVSIGAATEPLIYSHGGYWVTKPLACA